MRDASRHNLAARLALRPQILAKSLLSDQQGLVALMAMALAVFLWVGMSRRTPPVRRTPWSWHPASGPQLGEGSLVAGRSETCWSFT